MICIVLVDIELFDLCFLECLYCSLLIDFCLIFIDCFCFLNFFLIVLSFLFLFILFDCDSIAILVAN